MTDRQRGDAITWRGWKLDPAWFASHAAYLISDSIGCIMRDGVNSLVANVVCMRLGLNHHHVILSDGSLGLQFTRIKVSLL